MKKTKILIITVLLLVISFVYCQCPKKLAFAETGTTAKAMSLIDSTSGRQLYGKNESIRLPMASTTKIVTALTVLVNCDNIEKEIQVDDRAVGILGTSIYLKKGEKMTIKELLYGMMLPSGNDAATALAYSIGGSMENFCNMMNKTAQSVGAFNSNFKNPHGLDEDGHYTTALDLAKITASALKNDIFKEIVTTKNYRIRGSSEGTYRYLKNKNRLLSTLDGCIGVKTGYTGKAGRCLVSATSRDDFCLVCVVLNCGPMFEESEGLLNLAYKEYSLQSVIEPYSVIREIQVEDGRDATINVYNKRGFKYPLKKDEDDKIYIEYLLPNSIKAPINKDESVGTINIYLDNCLLFCEKIYTISSVKKVGVWGNIKDIASGW